MLTSIGFPRLWFAPRLISFDDVSLNPFEQPLIKIVITGFNTDIERDGVVYHVQTEDKGLDSPLILTLVYSGGEILAAKRTPYEDLIVAGFNDEALAERLMRQHRLICAAVNAGRIDELKRMNARPEGGARAISGTHVDVEQAPLDSPDSPPPEIPDDFVIESVAESPPVMDLPHSPAPAIDDDFVIENVSESPPVMDLPHSPAPPIDDDFIIEMDAEIRSRPQIHDDFVIETAAERPPVTDWPPKIEEVVAEPVAEAPPLAATLPVDQDTLPSPALPAPPEPAYTVHDSRRPSRPGKGRKREAGLVLTLLDEGEFRAGETVTIRVLLQHSLGDGEKPLGGMPVSVRILGTAFRPRLYSAKTQRNGVAVVSAIIPWFTSGRAAVLIRAEAHDQSAELRRAIQPAV